jgi:hypothetical protein
MKTFQTFLSTLMFVWISSMVAGAQPAENWPVTSTLSYSFCDKGQCNVSHPTISGSIFYGPEANPRRLFKTPRVIFGPFHLTRRINLADGSTTAAPSSTYHVEVWARSPAFYGADGRFAGTNLQLRMIGSATATLRGNDDADQDLFVATTLPGMVNALQFRATVNSTVAVRAFPGCSDLPPAGGSASLDAACLQAGVNPLAVINPHIMPLAIIYEPPGNCSYAGLAQTDVVGTTLSAAETSSTATQVLVDPGVIASATGAHPQNFSYQESAAGERIARLSLSQSQTYGTALSSGLPENCRQPGASVPQRANSGPGNGDVFLLLINQPLIYWDQGSLSNFLFGPPIVGTTKLLEIFAWELKSPAGLQKIQAENHVTITPDEAAALLKLDPLALTPAQETRAGAGPFLFPPLPQRLIPLQQPSISVAAGLSAGFSATRDQVVSADNRSCLLANTVSNTDSVGLTEKLAFAAGKSLLQVLGGAGADIAAAIGGGIGSLSPGQLIGETKTTVTLGFNSCKGLTQLSQNTDTQVAFLKDTNNGINAAAYYDSFFGTIAYVPLPLGMGVLTNQQAYSPTLPNFVFSVQARFNSDVHLSLPDEVGRKLASLGHTSLEPAPADNYMVPRNIGKGLAAGLELDARGNITGKLGTLQNSQGLYIVRDNLGKPVALLWVNVSPSV